MRKLLATSALSALFAIFFTIGGFAQTESVLASKNVKGRNWSPDIAVDEKGNAVVVWIFTNDENTIHHIYAASVNAKGSKLKSKKAIRISGNIQRNRYPTIRYQELSGTFLVAWEAEGDDRYSIRTRELDRFGKPVGSEKQLISSDSGFFLLRPILAPVERARKLKKSYVLVWYQVDSNTKRGAWSAVLSSSGEMSKKPKLVMETLYGSSSSPEVHPTSLTSNPNGGYLLGVSRIESDDFQIQRGHLIQLNKAGKKKKETPINGGDTVGFVSGDAVSEDRILVTSYDYNLATTTNQVFDSSLNPVGEPYDAYSNTTNGTILVRVGERLFQIFAITFFGFSIAEYAENGEVLAPPALIQSELPLNSLSKAVSVPGTQTILMVSKVTMLNDPGQKIYCIRYDVPEQN